MWRNRIHASDRELQTILDGELRDDRTFEIQSHISGCAHCRSRQDHLRQTMVEFTGAYRRAFDDVAGSASASRVALRARLAADGTGPRTKTSFWKYPVYAGCAVSCLLVLAVVLFHSDDETRLLPNPKITPGATRTVSLAELCSLVPSAAVQAIPSSTGQTVFGKYGIGDPKPGSYELDHLIDAELGGSDDLGNLWPQPYSTVWNARVKDALEEHLHELVCQRQISLSTAQHDVSKNWIAAYRKYFHTDKPILSHTAFTKDMPWSN